MPQIISGNNLRNHEEGLAYMVECTLATVAGHLLKKKPPKSELNRQISIAQAGLNCLGFTQTEYSCLRLKKINQEFGNSVQAWADDFRSRKVP